MTQQEYTTNAVQPGTLVVPPTQDFTSAGLQGSIQQTLAENLGRKVACEFWVGAENMETKSGILQYVNSGTIVLYDQPSGNSVICDAYSIKFVTMYPQTQDVPDTSQEIAPKPDDATRQPATEAPQNGGQEAPQTPAPAVPTPAQPMQISGVQPVNARAQAQAAFNYAKRKARR